MSYAGAATPAIERVVLATTTEKAWVVPRRISKLLIIEQVTPPGTTTFRLAFVSGGTTSGNAWIPIPAGSVFSVDFIHLAAGTSIYLYASTATNVAVMYW